MAATNLYHGRTGRPASLSGATWKECMDLNEYWSAHAVEEYKGMLYEQKVQNYTYNCERSAPHIIHNAKIFKDGNKYCCLLGDNLQDGIAGFGETPEKACSEFDRVWRGGKRWKNRH